MTEFELFLSHLHCTVYTHKMAAATMNIDDVIITLSMAMCCVVIAGRFVMWCTGLYGEHVLASSVEGRPTVLSTVPQQNQKDSSRRRQLEPHLDSRHFPSQWEGRRLSWRHCGKPDVDANIWRWPMVRYKVSNIFCWNYLDLLWFRWRFTARVTTQNTGLAVYMSNVVVSRAMK